MGKRTRLKDGSRCQVFIKETMPKKSNEFSDLKPKQTLCIGVLERVGKVAEKVPISEIATALKHEKGEETDLGKSLHFKWFTKQGADVRRKRLEQTHTNS
jgi:hypothetical protein